MFASQEILPNSWLVKLNKIEDLRGGFVKTVSESLLNTLNIDFHLKEEYFSWSKKNVIRGVHFQMPPYDHIKLVYCQSGAVLDVLLDLRPGHGYRKSYSLVLSAKEPKLLVIPKGVAHGFKSLDDDSLMIYKTSTEHSPQYDAGILWNSFGFDWGIDNPILSERDKFHPAFKAFESCF